MAEGGVQFACRIATSADLPQVADLRWRLRVDDQPILDRADYDRFIADFLRLATPECQAGEVIHWIAVEQAHIMGILSVTIVRTLPSPEMLRDRWGYISNTYVMPERRNEGLGQKLLSAVTDWARSEGLELLVVWPSERAYAFYERAGFARHSDPLVLKLRSDGL